MPVRSLFLIVLRSLWLWASAVLGQSEELREAELHANQLYKQGKFKEALPLRAKVVKLYDMLPADAGDTSEGRTAADNATARSVFVIGPDKKIKAMLIYPMSTGRNFDEILRLLDSCQLTAKEQVATPVNWKQGEDVVIVPAISDEDAKIKYPDGWNAPLPYLRYVPHPQ